MANAYRINKYTVHLNCDLESMMCPLTNIEDFERNWRQPFSFFKIFPSPTPLTDVRIYLILLTQCMLIFFLFWQSYDLQIHTDTPVNILVFCTTQIFTIIWTLRAQNSLSTTDVMNSHQIWIVRI